MAPSCGYITLFSKCVLLCSIVLQLLLLEHTVAELSLKSDSGGEQALKPGAYSPNTVPAFPVQTQTQTCRLDVSDELFGGVDEACGHNLDRSRCCPVLAAWLFSAHARTALQVPAPAPASSSSPSSSSDLPMMPDDSQKCVNSLQSSLQSRDIHLPQPNASCDAILCFCGIRLHQITSLSCPAAFNVSSYRSAAAPTAALKRLEHDCRNSSYAGCTRCLESLEKVLISYYNLLSSSSSSSSQLTHHCVTVRLCPIPIPHTPFFLIFAAFHLFGGRLVIITIYTYTYYTHHLVFCLHNHSVF